MPFVINGFKLLDLRKVNVGKASAWVTVALIVGFAIALPTTLYLQYAHGFNGNDMFGVQLVPATPYNAAVGVETKLASQGSLIAASHVSGWQHFAKMSPNPKSMLALVIGVGLVLLFTFGRLRFTKWPIHPVMFLIWATYPATWFAASFMVGWLIKSLVTRFGGGILYRNLKPLMFGLIAGEMVGGLITIIIGAIYWLLTGQPKSYSIMPT